MNRRSTLVRSAQELTVAWQVASLLLGYPDEALLARLPLLRTAVAGLHPALARLLGATLDALEQTPPGELAIDYVATFDHQRRCCLYLTYFAHGDTRQRGMALLRFTQTYRRAGLVLHEGELPDHLGVVLEFGATTDAAAARRLLLDHRAGLELLRISLQDRESRWAPVLQAVCATLPPLDGDELDAVARLAAQGPPQEEVGLEPYAMADAPDLLQRAPVPSRGGAR